MRDSIIGGVYMVNYREILRMSADGNYSIRQIKADAHCSHDTIKETMEAARAKGISWPLDDDVTNAELQYYLFPEKFASLPYYAMQCLSQARHMEKLSRLVYSRTSAQSRS